MRQAIFYFSLCILMLSSPSLYSQTLSWTTFDTGSNMSILINVDSTPEVLGTDIAIGDYIGVFYTDDLGALQCGGFTTWNGDTSQAISFAAYEDDSNTIPKDGFDDGDALVWRVRTLIDNIDYEATATYSTTTPFVSDYNADGFAQITDLSISATEVLGCTDPLYLEYNPAANTDDGSCLTFIIEGCTNPNYMEYNAAANLDDGSCLTLIIEGCTDPLYLEYNPAANIDDGSCQTLIIYGCTDTNYFEFNPAANVDDGSCETLKVFGCTDEDAQNYNPNANVDTGSCDYSCEAGFVAVTITYTTGDQINAFQFLLNQNNVLVEFNDGTDQIANETYTHHYCLPEGAIINFEGVEMTDLVIINCEEEIIPNGTTSQFEAGCNIGITELNSTDISVYPNPSEDLINIEWTGQNDQLKIYDSAGRIIWSQDISDVQKLQVDLSHYEKGIYFMELSGKTNSHTQQIIKN